ncbi:MAG: hypothetical protein AAF429_09055 [Pseudomonadota bacterium]
MKTSVITTISSKGGVAKTSLLLGMMMAAAATGRKSFMIDTDPNQPITKFEQVARENDYWDENLVKTTTILNKDANQGNLQTLMTELASQDYHYIFIDTKGGEGEFLGYVGQIADIILLPLGLSQAEVSGTQETLQYFDDLENPKNLGDTGLSIAPIKTVITRMPAPSQIVKTQQYTLDDIVANFDPLETRIPISSLIQNLLSYGLFHKIAEELKNESDPKDRVQARAFLNALVPYANLGDEVGAFLESDA